MENLTLQDIINRTHSKKGAWSLTEHPLMSFIRNKKGLQISSPVRCIKLRLILR